MGARMGRGGGALLFGRWTYEKIAERLARSSRRTTRSGRCCEAQHEVRRSRGSREPSSGRTPSCCSGDAVEAVADLKARTDGNLVILGSGELIQALLPHGLIDAFLLTIHPLVLGSGTRLFPDDGALARFKLVESKPTTTGVLITRYEAAVAERGRTLLLALQRLARRRGDLDVDDLARRRRGRRS